MSRGTSKKRGRGMSEKQDVYSRITDRIVADLEKGIKPWLQPWQAGHAAGPVSRPLRSVGIPYQGVNILMLWATAMEKNYVCPIWLTYKQAQELGGQVRGGEKGALVVYANTYKKTTKDENGEDVEAAIPFMKGYIVFNVEQIDRLPAHYYAQAMPVHDAPLERITHLETFFAATKADIRHGGNRAYYRLDADFVQMPPLQAFREVEGYYATAAHELCHWTRHPSRLDRDLGRKRFADAGYAMEELVAEIGSAFLCADLGLTPEPREDHAAYIGSWLKVLKNDKRAIFSAAGHAQKATDYLHGLQLQPSP